MEKFVYLDCDGCLADFDKFVAEVHPNYDRDSVNKKDFWDPLSKIPNFFYKLEVLQDCYDMYWRLKNEGVGVEILTALPLPTRHFITAADDKMRWVRDNIDPFAVVHTVVGGKNKVKWLDQKPNAILVDDYRRNIDLWQEAGGVAVLHKTGKSELSYLAVKNIFYNRGL